MVDIFLPHPSVRQEIECTETHTPSAEPLLCCFSLMVTRFPSDLTMKGHAQALRRLQQLNLFLLVFTRFDSNQPLQTMSIRCFDT